MLNQMLSIFGNYAPVALTRQAYMSKVYGTRLDPRYLNYKYIKHKQLTVGDASIKINIENIGGYREVQFAGRNERSIINDIIGEVGKKDVFLDVGANIGIHSLLISQKCKKVYSIEPHPMNLSHLCMNKSINESNRVDIYGIGLSDVSGYTELSGPRTSMEVDGEASVVRRNTDNESTIYVRTETGEELFERNNLEHPTVVKIDVEGVEEEVLEGLDRLVADEDCKTVYCEVHEDEADFEKIRDLLESMGYGITTIESRKRGRTIKAKQ